MLKLKRKKVCILTGCTSGLGYNILLKLLEKDIFIYGVSNNRRKINTLRKNLLNKSFSTKNFFSYKVDISDYTQVKNFVKKIKSKHKKIDILINNAAINGPMGKFENISLRVWKKAFNINFFGSLNFFKNVLPIMKKNKYGRIVQMSGGGGTSPFPMFSSYATAKAGITSLSENLSKELDKKENITINSIAPGALNTNFTKIKLKAGPQKIGKAHYLFLKQIAELKSDSFSDPVELCLQLIDEKNKINGKIISAKWDNWKKFLYFEKEINSCDIFTNRRLTSDKKIFKGLTNLQKHI